MKTANTMNINEVREDCKVGDKFTWLGFGDVNMAKDVTIQITYISREDDFSYIVGNVVKQDGKLSVMKTSWYKSQGVWKNSNLENRNHGLFVRRTLSRG